jgi:transposase
VHGTDAEGKVLIRHKLKRCYLIAFFEKLQPCLVGIEACPHRIWSREIKTLGHTVRLMPSAYVKPLKTCELRILRASGRLRLSRS